MEITIRKAGIEDLDLLAATRAETLRAANRLPADADMRATEQAAREYYSRCFDDDSHVALLAFDGDRCVGTGGVSYYAVMPVMSNPTGRKAYIMNMYTHPDYRRRGIARRMLGILVEETLARGIDFITLEATQMGRPLYEAFGFRPMTDEMQLPRGWRAENGK